MTSRIEDDFELELRSLPGVLNVALEKDDGGVVTMVTLVAVGLEVKETEAVARQVASLYYPHAAVRVDDAGDVLQHVPTDDSRIVLVSAVADPTDGAIRVELSHGGRHGQGWSRNGALIGGAEATLLAMAELGYAVPFVLHSVTPFAASRTWPVAVTLRALADGSERYGIAKAEDETVAAAKATLDALNRFPLTLRTTRR